MKHFLKHSYSPFLDFSVQQVKFLLSVADDYEFICPAPAIYFDPVTYQPTFCIDRLHQAFCADFLIRNRIIGQAFLIEVLPDFLADDPRLLVRRQIAENYIAGKGHDWKYKCLFEEEILLTSGESMLFDSYAQMCCEEDRREWLMDYLSFSYLLKPVCFQSPHYSLLDFLIHGILPETL